MDVASKAEIIVTVLRTKMIPILLQRPMFCSDSVSAFSMIAGSESASWVTMGMVPFSASDSGSARSFRMISSAISVSVRIRACQDCLKGMEDRGKQKEK